MTKILLYTQLNATMPQVGMKVLLHAGILSFYHFEIFDRRINALTTAFQKYNIQ
jgi:hypothetical protein